MSESASLQLMLEPRAAELLAGFGIEYVGHELATTADEAAAAARRVGFPAVLKIVSPDVVHKSDVGGVVLDVTDETAARERFAELVARVHTRAPDARLEGVLVCRQITGPRAELIVGSLRDATFGPVVMLGAGGVFAEVLGDVSFSLAPLHEDDGMDMLRELKAFKTLTGHRDTPPLDTTAIARVAAALGVLMIDRPEVAEVDLNPIFALPQGCRVADARIMTAAG
jgi:acyl-CoA synthetase (NDP forming)